MPLADEDWFAEDPANTSLAASSNAIMSLAALWHETMMPMMSASSLWPRWNQLSDYERSSHWICVERILREADLLKDTIGADATRCWAVTAENTCYSV